MTVQEYDADGDLVERTDAAGNVYTFDYNADGQLVGQTDPEGASFQYEYDANGRLYTTIDGNGNEIFREYGSDETSSSGACTSCGSTPLLGGAGGGYERLQKIIYPTFTKAFRYDEEGRVSEEVYTFTGGESSSVAYAYDRFGRLQSTTGPDGRSTTYQYDLMGRRIRVDDPSGSTRFEYDNWDNLIALIDANNQRTGFEYDSLGRLKKEIRPMGQHSTYAYDLMGRVWKMVDAKNQITEYGYDNQSRLETISYADGKTVTLSYDADGNLAGYDDGVTSASYSYDVLGRKLSETVNYGLLSKSFSYSYTTNGLKQTFTAPDGTVYTYSYGSNNELRAVQIPGLGAITMADYQWNRPTTVLYPGGGTREYEYDGLMRLTHLTARDPGGNMLLDSSYEYDHRGNIVSKQTEHGRYIYGYDVSSRLTSAEHPVLDDETYAYDAVGNRTTASNADGSISHNANHELLLYGTTEYTYDANGNLTQKNVGRAAVNYIYNAENRLVKVEDDLTNMVMAEYGYDPFGRRLWKDVQGVRTYFFYSDEGLIAEYDASGHEIKSYGYQPDSTWTTDPLWLKQDGEYYFYQNDHLGTPQKLVAQNGAVVWSALYSSFGRAEVQIETITNNLRFPGQYEDEETGLHYNWFRYYEPETGRYMRLDPIGFNGGAVNLYEYAKSSPINVSDNMGLSIFENLWYGRPEYLKKLPGIARNMGWTHLAELFDGWFRNIAVIPYDLGRRSNEPDITTIKMSWVLGFDYAKQVYEKMIRDKIYQNAAALDRIRQEPQRVGITSFTSGIFGASPPSPMNPWKMLRFHDDHELNTRAVEGNMWDTEDALFAALAKFNFFVVITKGDIAVHNPTYQAACIRVTEIGIYVRDSFDFIDEPGKRSQPLGFWSTLFNRGGPIPLPDFLIPWNMATQYIENVDFRRYQAATGRGGDFYIFSDIRRIPITHPEWVALPLDPGFLPKPDPLPEPPILHQ